MAEDDAAFRQPLGAGRADVILTKRLDHGGPHVAGMAADAGDGDGGHRQHQMFKRIPQPLGADRAHAASRQDAQQHGEDDNEKERQPEGGHGNTGKSQQVDRVICFGVGPGGGPDAARQGDQQRQGETGAQQDHRISQGRNQHLEDRLGMQAGKTEIAAQRRPQPVGVAFDQRLIEAIQGPQAFSVFRGNLRIGADHQVDRIARHQPHQPVDDKGHDRQDDGGLDQSVEQVSGHVPIVGAQGRFWQGGGHRSVPTAPPVSRLWRGQLTFHHPNDGWDFTPCEPTVIVQERFDITAGIAADDPAIPQDQFESHEGHRPAVTNEAFLMEYRLRLQDRRQMGNHHLSLGRFQFSVSILEKRSEFQPRFAPDDLIALSFESYMNKFAGMLHVASGAMLLVQLVRVGRLRE